MIKPQGYYKILYKHPNAPVRYSDDYIKLGVFEGYCKHFTTSYTDLCAFYNEDNEWLLVRYKDIVQMKAEK